MVEVTCQQCAQSFTVKPSRLKDGGGKYCSRTCWHTANKPGVYIPCHGCGKKTYKQPKALKASKSGKFFCGKSCQTTWRNTIFVLDKHSNWKDGTHAYRRIIKQSNAPLICGRCHTTDQRILAVHHIDQNRKNNAIENLTYLCHNCHHLIHHFPDEHKKYMATMV